MKKFIEKVKDFLYDAIDFVLIFVIIIAVAGIIGWRLDILFANDMDKPPIEDVTDNDSNDKNIIDKNDDSEDKDDKDLADNEDIDNNEDDQNQGEDLQGNDSEDEVETQDEQGNENNATQDVTENEIVTIKIPSGSLPPTIANILLEKSLINNKMDFLKKCQELELDTKLKSGEFEIKKNSSLETIIRTLAK